MKNGRWILAMALLAMSAGMGSQWASAQSAGQDPWQSTTERGSGDSQACRADEAELLASSREAGLLTDWHLEGRFGHGGSREFARAFAPEKLAKRQAKKTAAWAEGRGSASNSRGFAERRYELVFPEGTFALPLELAGLPGVFYANSSTYLSGGGEWNVYLESRAEAVVFVDGRAVLTRSSKATGVLRETIHVESGYHTVMVKFVAGAAPFRVAILPPNSGSRRKNNTPSLKASPGSEEMQAGLAMPVGIAR